MNSATGEYKDDPTPTYRGYRRQALYCLFRLFDDGLPENSVIHPEGNEDLAIYNPDGELIEIVQVKDHSSPLTVSSIGHPFYKRISEYCVPNSKVAVKIATFGDVGPELAKALDNEQGNPKRSIETLVKERHGKPGLSLEEAKNIFSHLESEQVNEEILTSKLLDQLKGTITSGDPVRAFEYLMWWLVSSSEQQKKLNRLQTIDQLNQIGRFIDHRAAHEHEWNISIKPIEYPSPEKIEEEKLRSEFFQGGRVRPKHIAAKLDVPRVEALHEIHKLFQQENVVILRAASGQGKTTLAYRYLLEWAPDDFRYEILQAADLQHARRMSEAIKGHTEAIDVPTVVYLDVRPGDNLWIEFVRELSEVSSLRILVTIREEDWFRSRVTKDQFSFIDYSVDFDEATGRRMFDALKLNGYGSALLNFAEAWSRLGERKTLFEFVYLTTQNEQLSDRIKSQISSLKDQVNSGGLGESELQLLRLVAVASAYEARLSLKELVAAVEISEPTRTLERFSNEYLLRTSDDGRYVEGFHAIRSEIISAELTDAVLQSRGEIEADVIPLLVEDDLESFLLCSFSRNQDSADKLVQSLGGLSFQTWSGARGVFTALQWLGLKRYVDENVALIENVRMIYGSGWWIVLDWDLAQVRGKTGFGFLNSLRHMSNEMELAATSAEQLQKQQTNKDEVFAVISMWLNGFKIPAEEPFSEYQMMASAEIMFWMGHLNLKSDAISEWFHEELIIRAWRILPIHLFAAFAYACRKINPETYSHWLSVNFDEVQLKLRSSLSLIAVIEEEDCLVSHFVIDDIDRKNSEIRPSDDVRSINQLAIDRIDVISQCLPGYKKYGTAGYGHQNVLFGESIDESTKHIPVENLTMPWLPEFNALARGIVELQFRPENWNVYFDQVYNMRKRVVASFKNLQTTIKNKKSELALKEAESWDECLRNLKSDLYLPANSVDEWGYITESRGAKSFERILDTEKDKEFTANVKKFSAFEKFGARSTLDPLNKALDEYTRTVSNFMEQSKHGVKLIPMLRTVDTKSARKKILEISEKMGLNENSIRLSVLNGFDACAAVKKLHYAERSLERDIKGIKTDDIYRESELQEFLETIRAWSLFCYPEQIMAKAKPSQKKKKSNEKRQKTICLSDSLISTKNRIKNSLQSLRKAGIEAQVISDTLKWEDESALWITFDTKHPLGTLVALDHIWNTFIDSFKPDTHKIVKIKSVEYYWKKIVLIPLVKGQSLDKQAFPNISGVTFMVGNKPEPNIRDFTPELIPISAWDDLELPFWKKRQEWEVFDKINNAYTTLYYHVNHLADFSRCSVDLDEAGEKILKDYIKIEEKRVEPYLQETFDACARLFELIGNMKESILKFRPNILDCSELMVSMQDSLFPCEDYDQEASLTIDEISNWRDRLQTGFQILAQARCLWVADSLGLGRYEHPE